MKIFNNFAKYKIKTNKVLNFPKLQVVSAKFDENNTMQLRNLKIRSILLNESEILNRKEKKIIFYYPFHQSFLNDNFKFELTDYLLKMMKKYNTHNFVMIGHTSKKDIETFYSNHPILRESSEFLMIDVLRLGEINKLYGYKDIAIVLDENGKIIYTNKNILLRNFTKMVALIFLLMFNFVYIPAVDDLINKN
jgi:hypothetical protein